MLIELLKMCSYLFLNRERNHTWHISKPFRVDTAQGISTTPGDKNVILSALLTFINRLKISIV